MCDVSADDIIVQGLQETKALCMRRYKDDDYSEVTGDRGVKKK